MTIFQEKQGASAPKLPTEDQQNLMKH